MAAIIAGPAVGGLVGAAVYYTISQTISSQTSSLRSELHTCSQILAAQAEPSVSGTSFYAPLPPAPTSAPPSLPPVGELIKSKWNATLETAVKGLGSTDWEAVGMNVWEGGKVVVGKVVEGVEGLQKAAGSEVATVKPVEGKKLV